MHKFITTLSLFAGLTLGAQNSELHVRITMDQPLNGATWTSEMTIDFSMLGSHFNDGLDMTAMITNDSVAHPFTINSSYQSLLVRDARPFLYAPRNFAFGVWNKTAGTLHIESNWAVADDSLLYDVTFFENGNEHNLYNEVGCFNSVDTSFASRYIIRISPKMHAEAFDVTCSGSEDGSVYAASPSPNWGVDVYHNSVFMNTVNVVSHDTLLTGLQSGNYMLVYTLFGQPTDTQNVVVNNPAPVISSATLSTTTPMEGEDVTFTNTSGGATVYAWDFGDGLLSADVSPLHSYSTAGIYTVTLIASNANGCADTATFQVDVQMAPMAVPPLGDRSELPNEYNTARVLATVQSQNNTAALSVTGDATISQFSVYSMNGQLLFRGSGAEKTFTYDTPGIYLIQILYTDGTAESKSWYLN